MFFQDTRSIGLVFWIVVGLQLFTGVTMLLAIFMDGLVILPDEVLDHDMYCITMGVGSLVTAAMYGYNAHKVMSRSMSRIKVLRDYVVTVGLCTLLGGIFNGGAMYLFTSEPLLGIMMTMGTIVTGIIVTIVGMIIDNGKRGILKKIIWAILVIAFALMFVFSLLEAGSYLEFADNVAHLLLSFFMLALITDSEVRKEMGAKS